MYILRQCILIECMEFGCTWLERRDNYVLQKHTFKKLENNQNREKPNYI